MNAHDEAKNELVRRASSKRCRVRLRGKDDGMRNFAMNGDLSTTSADNTTGGELDGVDRQRH